MRLAERCLLDRLSWFGDPSGQGHLPPMTTEGVRSNGQDDVGAGLDREHQQQTGGMADVRVLKTRRPRPTGLRGHQRLGGSAWKRLSESNLQPVERVVKRHGSA